MAELQNTIRQQILAQADAASSAPDVRQQILTQAEPPAPVPAAAPAPEAAPEFPSFTPEAQQYMAHATQPDWINRVPAQTDKWALGGNYLKPVWGDEGVLEYSKHHATIFGKELRGKGVPEKIAAQQEAQMRAVLLEAARADQIQKHKNVFARGGKEDVLRSALEGAPWAGYTFGALQGRRLEGAKERFAKGEATNQDYGILGQDLARQEEQAKRSGIRKTVIDPVLGMAKFGVELASIPIPGLGAGISGAAKTAAATGGAMTAGQRAFGLGGPGVFYGKGAGGEKLDWKKELTADLFTNTAWAASGPVAGFAEKMMPKVIQKLFEREAKTVVGKIGAFGADVVRAAGTAEAIENIKYETGLAKEPGHLQQGDLKGFLASLPAMAVFEAGMRAKQAIISSGKRVNQGKLELVLQKELEDRYRVWHADRANRPQPVPGSQVPVTEGEGIQQPGYRALPPVGNRGVIPGPDRGTLRADKNELQKMFGIDIEGAERPSPARPNYGLADIQSPADVAKLPTEVQDELGARLKGEAPTQEAAPRPVAKGREPGTAGFISENATPAERLQHSQELFDAALDLKDRIESTTSSGKPGWYGMIVGEDGAGVLRVGGKFAANVPLELTVEERSAYKKLKADHDLADTNEERSAIHRKTVELLAPASKRAADKYIAEHLAKVGQKPKPSQGVRREEAPKAPEGPVSFETAQGSQYQFENGTSQRTKTPHIGHETKDVGLKKRSDKTIFINNELAQEIGMWGSSSASNKHIVLHEGKIHLISDNPATKQPGRDKILNPDQGYSEQPAIGLSPLELWGTGQYENSFRSSHPGNVITRMTKGAPHEEAPAPKAPEGPVVTRPKDTGELQGTRASEVAGPAQEEGRPTVPGPAGPAREVPGAERQRVATEEYPGAAPPTPAKRSRGVVAAEPAVPGGDPLGIGGPVVRVEGGGRAGDRGGAVEGPLDVGGPRSTDIYRGVNAAGEHLYVTAEGQNYRLRNDRPTTHARGLGGEPYRDYGGDLAPVTEGGGPGRGGLRGGGALTPSFIKTAKPPAPPQIEGGFITLYHGSPEAFEAFDSGKATRTGLGGKGHFFSSFEQAYKAYGENVYAIRVPKELLPDLSEIGERFGRVRDFDAAVKKAGLAGYLDLGTGEHVVFDPNQFKPVRLTEAEKAQGGLAPPGAGGGLRGGGRIEPVPGHMFRAFENPDEAIGKNRAASPGLEWYEGQPYLLEFQAGPSEEMRKTFQEFPEWQGVVSDPNAGANMQEAISSITGDPHHKGHFTGDIDAKHVRAIYYYPEGGAKASDIEKLKQQFPLATFRCIDANRRVVPDEGKLAVSEVQEANRIRERDGGGARPGHLEATPGGAVSGGPNIPGQVQDAGVRGPDTSAPKPKKSRGVRETLTPEQKRAIREQVREGILTPKEQADLEAMSKIAEKWKPFPPKEMPAARALAKLAASRGVRTTEEAPNRRVRATKEDPKAAPEMEEIQKKVEEFKGTEAEKERYQRELMEEAGLGTMETGGIGGGAPGVGEPAVVPTPGKRGNYFDLSIGGEKKGYISFGDPVTQSKEGRPNDADTVASSNGWPGVTKPGETVARITQITVDKEHRGKGLGQKLYLEGMLKHGADWYYNIQTDSPATNTLKALQKKGLIELHWERDPRPGRVKPEPAYGEKGGWHLVRLTEAGKIAAQGDAGGIGGGAPGGVRDLTPPLRTTALKKAVMTKERIENKLPPIPAPAHRPNDVPWNAALAKRAADPSLGERLSNEIAKTHRAVSDEELSILLQHKIVLDNQYHDIMNKYLKILKDAGTLAKTSPEVMAALEHQVDEMKGKIDQHNRVTDETGTGTARALQFRKQFAKEDFSLAKMQAEAAVAKKGNLTHAENIKVAEIQAKIADLQARLDGGEDTPEVRIALKNAKREYRQFIEEQKRESETQTQRIFRGTGEVYGLSRMLQTAWDLSATLRQGATFTFGHPIKAGQNFVRMLHAFGSERSFDMVMDDIEQRPLYKNMVRDGIHFSDPSENPKAREEIFFGKWVGKIPGLAGSERAYNAFLNLARADLYEAMTASFTKEGRYSRADGATIAKAVNVGTGRGNLYGFENSAKTLTHIYYSPLFVMSRFQYLFGLPKLLTPYGGSPAARKAIAKEYARTLTGLGMFYLFLSLHPDSEFEWDSRSSDFGKVKFGNTRIDPMFGMSQVIVLLSRMLTGQTKSSTTGLIEPLTGTDVRYGAQEMLDVPVRFIRSKLAPVPGVGVNLLTGKDVIGRPIASGVVYDFAKEHGIPEAGAIGLGQGGELVGPLALADVMRAFKDLGVPEATAISLLVLLGTGKQTYEPKPPSKGVIKCQQVQATNQRLSDMGLPPIPKKAPKMQLRYIPTK